MIIYDKSIPEIQYVDYHDVWNKPSINNIILDGSLSLNDLGITSMNTFNQQTELFRLDLSSLRGSKQDKLISGVNIKTVNGQDLLGNGNVTIEVPVKSVNGMVGDVIIDVPSLIPSNYITYDKLYAENYLKEVPANYVTYNGLSNYIQEISKNIVPCVFIGNDSIVNVASLNKVVNAIKNNKLWLAFVYFNSTDYIVKGAYFEDDEKTVVFYINNAHCNTVYTWRVNIETGEYSPEIEELGYLTPSSLDGINNSIETLSSDIQNLDTSVVNNYYTKTATNDLLADINNDISNINSNIVTINQNLTTTDEKFSNYYTKTNINSLLSEKISVGNNTVSSENQVTTIQVLTNDQYNALATIDANTLYIIK